MIGVGSILGALLIAIVVQRDHLWRRHADERRIVQLYTAVSLIILGFALVVVAASTMSGATEFRDWELILVSLALGSGLTLLLGSLIAEQLEPWTSRAETKLPQRSRPVVAALWSYVYALVAVGVVVFVYLRVR